MSLDGLTTSKIDKCLKSIEGWNYSGRPDMDREMRLENGILQHRYRDRINEDSAARWSEWVDYEGFCK